MHNWLIIQSAGEHEENKWFRECWAIASALADNACSVDVWGLRHDNFISVPDFNSYDAILCLENYGLNWLPDFKKIAGPKKFHWIVDLHCQPANVYDEMSNGCDVVLHSTKSLISSYQKRHPDKRHIWFPNGVDNRYFYQQKRTKIMDLAFVASNHPSRERFVQNVSTRTGMHRSFLRGQAMIDRIAESKIHFNKNIGVDVNYRTFETIGIGTCLLTDFKHEMLDLGFIDGYNCLMYNDIDDLIRKYEYAIKENKWEEIGNNGAVFAKQHTYTQRIYNLLKEIS